MFHLVTAKRFAGGKDVIIHTDTDAWAGVSRSWYHMDFDILRFWTTFSFVKGVIFDVSQRSFQLADIGTSVFHVNEMANTIMQSPPVENHTYDIREDIDFFSLPHFSDNSQHYINDWNDPAKVAVFQPMSTIHKDLNNLHIPSWDASVKALLDKGYEIAIIGSAQDGRDIEKYYPNLLERYPMRDLTGKTSMFESIDLVMNCSSFVLSCDSWSFWYGIASRKKTVAAVNASFFQQETSRRNPFSAQFSQAFGNEDVYKTCFAGSDNCDATLANWINENA